MRLLIDGYNLLHATDVFGEGPLAGTLQGAREALVRQLAARLPGKLRCQTWVVFDAAGAPPGLPDRVDSHQMTVAYARGYADADTLIEELIEACRAPRELLVVSSDHRVQRAARRRGAGWTDSGTWHSELLRQSPDRTAQPRMPSESSRKPEPSPTDTDVAFWTERVGDPATLEHEEGPPPRANTPPDSEQPRPRPKPPAAEPPPIFPPGYADDLAREFEGGDRASDEADGN